MLQTHQQIANLIYRLLFQYRSLLDIFHDTLPTHFNEKMFTACRRENFFHKVK